MLKGFAAQARAGIAGLQEPAAPRRPWPPPPVCGAAAVCMGAVGLVPSQTAGWITSPASGFSVLVVAQEAVGAIGHGDSIDLRPGFGGVDHLAAADVDAHVVGV